MLLKCRASPSLNVYTNVIETTSLALCVHAIRSESLQIKKMIVSAIGLKTIGSMCGSDNIDAVSISLQTLVAALQTHGRIQSKSLLSSTNSSSTIHLLFKILHKCQGNVTNNWLPTNQSKEAFKNKSKSEIFEYFKRMSYEIIKLVLHSITLLARQNSHIKSGFQDGYVCNELFDLADQFQTQDTVVFNTIQYYSMDDTMKISYSDTVENQKQRDVLMKEAPDLFHACKNSGMTKRLLREQKATEQMFQEKTEKNNEHRCKERMERLNKEYLNTMDEVTKKQSNIKALRKGSKHQITAQDQLAVLLENVKVLKENLEDAESMYEATKMTNMRQKKERNNAYAQWDAETSLSDIEETDLWNREMNERHVTMQYIILALWTCSTSYNHNETVSNRHAQRTIIKNQNKAIESIGSQDGVAAALAAAASTDTPVPLNQNIVILASNHLSTVCTYIKDNSEFICYCACQTISLLARDEQVANELYRCGALAAILDVLETDISSLNEYEKQERSKMDANIRKQEDIESNDRKNNGEDEDKVDEEIKKRRKHRIKHPESMAVAPQFCRDITSQRREAMAGALCYLTVVHSATMDVMEREGIQTIAYLLDVARKENRGLKKAYLAATLMNISKVTRLVATSTVAAAPCSVNQNDLLHIVGLLTNKETNLYMYGIISITELSKVSYINQLFSQVNVSQALHAIAFEAWKRCNKGSNNSDNSVSSDNNRDMNLLETIMGAWVVLSTNVNHHRSFVESNVLSLCVDLLRWNKSTDTLLYRTLNILWRSCAVSTSSTFAIEKNRTHMLQMLLGMELPLLLKARIYDTTQAVELRALCMNVFEILATSKCIAKEVTKQAGVDNVLERYYLYLLQQNVSLLQISGAKGLSRISLLPNKKAIIYQIGAVRQIVKTLTESKDPDVLSKCAHCLMNITAESSMQITPAAQKSIPIIIQHAIQPVSKELHMFTVRVLSNLSRHGKNRSLLYREELRWKAKFAYESKKEQERYNRWKQLKLKEPFNETIGTYNEMDYDSGNENNDYNKDDQKEPMKIPTELEESQQKFNEWLTETFDHVPSSSRDIKFFGDEKVPNSYTDSARPETMSLSEEYKAIRPLLELEPERITLKTRLKKNPKGRIGQNNRSKRNRRRPKTAGTSRRQPKKSPMFARRQKNQHNQQSLTKRRRPSTAGSQRKKTKETRGIHKISPYKRPKRTAQASDQQLSQLLRKSLTSTWRDTSQRTVKEQTNEIKSDLLRYVPSMPPSPRPKSSQGGRRITTPLSRTMKKFNLSTRTMDTMADVEDDEELNVTLQLTLPTSLKDAPTAVDLRLQALEDTNSYLQPIVDTTYNQEEPNNFGFDQWTPRIEQIESIGMTNKDCDLNMGGNTDVGGTDRADASSEEATVLKNKQKEVASKEKRLSTAAATATTAATSATAAATTTKSKKDNDTAPSPRHKHMRVTLRPKSARSRFVFGKPTPPLGFKPNRTITNSKTIEKSLKMQNEDASIHNNETTADTAPSPRVSFVLHEDRPVRLWKWNHIKGSHNMANFKQYSLQTEDGGTAYSFFNLIRIHEAECPLDDPISVDILLSQNDGQHNEKLPPLNHPPHDTLPPKQQPLKQSVPASSTHFVPIYSRQILSLQAHETEVEVIPFSLRSLLHAFQLRPKHPMTKSFISRKIISDSRGITENKDMYLRAFELDWSKISKKKGLFKNVLNIKNDHDIDWIKRACIKHYPRVFQAYAYYSCIGSGSDHFIMAESEFRLCLHESKITQPLSSTSSETIRHQWLAGKVKGSIEELLSVQMNNERLHREISVIFQQTNIEERVDPNVLKTFRTAKASDLSECSIDQINSVDDVPGDSISLQKFNDINPDRGFMRFEFLEALLRLAAYMKSTDDSCVVYNNSEEPFQQSNARVSHDGSQISAGIDLMFTKYFISNLPDRSKMRHDVWRTRRLYTLEVDKTIQSNKKTINCVFKRYCDYTFSFEKKSGRKHFKRTNNLLDFLNAGNDGKDGNGGGETKNNAGDHEHHDDDGGDFHEDEVAGHVVVANHLDTVSTTSSQKSSTKKTKKRKKIKIVHKKKKRSKKKFVSDLMPLKGWYAFLKDYNLLATPHNKNGISLRDATIIFVYSKMGIMEEVVDRFLYTHMDVCAFYEGLGRLAEYLRVPSITQLMNPHRKHHNHSSHKKHRKQLHTIEKYFQMDDLEPQQQVERIQHLFNNKKSALDSMCVFGEDFHHGSKDPLAEKMDMLIAYIGDTYNREKKE